MAENFDIDDATEFLAFEGRDNAIEEWILEKNNPSASKSTKQNSGRISRKEMEESIKNLNKK